MPAEVPLAFDSLVEEGAEDDEQEDEEDAKYGHPALVRVLLPSWP